MRIIPVIDVMDGVVVRAVAGRREHYLPLRSRLVRSVEPFDVARALLDATGATELYVADLTGLMEGNPDRTLLGLASGLGVEVWLDIGLKSADGWIPAPEVRPIIATETWEGTNRPPHPPRCAATSPSGGEVRREVFSHLPPGGGGRRAAAGGGELSASGPILSLDYYGNRLIRKKGAKPNPVNFPTAIVLDTTAVGVGGGIRTILQCIKLRQQFPRLDLVTGGGVRNRDDLRELEGIGVNGVLVASALHDGVSFG